MIPTLLVGDYLFVSKYSYGYSPPLASRSARRSSRAASSARCRSAATSPSSSCRATTAPTTSSASSACRATASRCAAACCYINGQPVPARARRATSRRGHRPRHDARTLYRETLPERRVASRSSRTSDDGPLDNTAGYSWCRAGHVLRHGRQPRQLAGQPRSARRGRLRPGREPGRPRRVHVLLLLETGSTGPSACWRGPGPWPTSRSWLHRRLFSADPWSDRPGDTRPLAAVAASRAPSAGIATGRCSATLRKPDAAGRGADPSQRRRRQRVDTAAARQRAAGVPRRPRARPGRRRHAAGAASRTSARASLAQRHAALVRARGAGRRSRARSAWARRSMLAKGEDAAGGRDNAGDPGRRLRGGDRRALSRRRARRGARLRPPRCGSR